MDETRRQRGERTRDEVMNVGQRPVGSDPSPWDQAVVDFVFGEVWSRPGLSRRDRRLITLACVGAAGPGRHVDSHVYAALNSGDITLEEMREFVVQFAVYSGFPMARSLKAAVDEQWARIEDERRTSG